MKNLIEYIKESASLFDDWSSRNTRFANNFIEYNEGDKKFGELNKGDVIYFCELGYQNKTDVVELTVKGELTKRNKMICLPINKVSGINNNSSLLEIGPVDGGASFGNGKTYSPQNVENCSVCVNTNGGAVFGTNKDIVVRISRSNIGTKIEEIKSQIENLQNLLNELNIKLENLV